MTPLDTGLERLKATAADYGLRSTAPTREDAQRIVTKVMHEAHLNAQALPEPIDFYAAEFIALVAQARAAAAQRPNYGDDATNASE